MKRFGRLFEQVASLSNLWGAWRDFRRGKRSRPSVLAFELEVDRRLIGVRQALMAGTYRPGPYRLLLLHEPKRRLIAAAPVPDRVVHHAVYRVLSPRLDRRLIATTFACLPLRGSHRAVLAYLTALRRWRFVLHLDIRHYFLSIDRRILLDLMARRIKDRRLLALLTSIAASGAGLYDRPAVREFLSLPDDFPGDEQGLPIGNLTSQWWGNHYLSDLDHFVKRDLKIPYYQRYMDDFTLFGNSRAALETARETIAEWLGRERHLRLKHPRAPVRSTKGRFTYLGYRVSRAGVGPSNQMLRRLEHRVTEQLLHGDAESLESCLASYRGVVAFVEPRGRKNDRSVDTPALTTDTLTRMATKSSEE